MNGYRIATFARSYPKPRRLAMPLPQITSRSNPKIREAASLRNRQQRDRLRQTLVYGVRETARALATGATPLRAFVCPPLFRIDDAGEVTRQLDQAGCEVFEVTREVFERVAYGDRLDGVITVVATPDRNLSALQIPPQPLVAVIEGIEKPGNLGAILRSADGAGVDAVIVVDPTIDLFNPNTIRSSVATVFKSNVAVAPLAETLAWLKNHQLSIWGARPDADQLYYDADLTLASALVLGNEAHGLSAAWQEQGMQGLRLPMRGSADSLNVSAAAAVLFYEASRQRHANRAN
jgi:TrmH family RNA methyltransferase